MIALLRASGWVLLLALILVPESPAQKSPVDPRPLTGLSPEAVPRYASVEAFLAAHPGRQDLRAGATLAGTAVLDRQVLGSLSLHTGSNLRAALPTHPNGLTGLHLERSPNGTLRWLRGSLGQVNLPPAGAGKQTATRYTEAAHELLQRHAPLLGLDEPRDELRPIRTVVDELGYTHVRFEQQYEGLPVWGRDLYVHFDETGTAYALNGTYEPTPRNVTTRPTLSPADAERVVVQDLKTRKRWAPVRGRLAAELGLDAMETRLVLYPDAGGTIHLAYEISLHPNFMEWYTYLVDARRGTVLNRIQRHCTLLQHPHDAPLPDTPVFLQVESRTGAGSFVDATGVDLNGTTQSFRVFLNDDGTYVALSDLDNLTAENVKLPLPDRGGAVTFTANGQDLSEQNPPVVVTSPNNAWTDPSAVSAHVNQERAYRYYKDVHGRNAIDGQDQPLVSVIRVTQGGQPMDNAFWNGRIMAYGDGDQIFTPLAGALDVAGHEMSHGVIQHTANLVYQFQPGALNESFADVFGIMVDPEDFLIGEDVMRPGKGPALRDFLNPDNAQLLQPQPAHMNQYQNLGAEQDNGGVHINSGIPNRAAALVIQALGHARTERIYYRALTTYLTRNSQFGDARNALIQAATDLYGAGSAEVDAVTAAFDAVGITASTGTGGGAGNDIPVQQGGSSLITFLLDDGSIGLIDVTDPQNITGGVFNHPNAVARVDPGTGDYAQLTTTRDGRTIWFVDPQGRLAFLEVETGNVSVFQDLYLQQPGDLWNASIAPDGNLVALVSAYANDPTLYLFDGTQIGAIPLEPESTQEGIKVNTIQFPDVVAWSPNPQVPRLAFDAFNAVTFAGSRSEFWSMYEIDFASGRIYNLLPAQPPALSVGNITYSSGDPDFVAFNVIDNASGVWDVALGNFETGELYTLNVPGTPISGVTITDGRRPSFAPDDTQLVFSTAQYGALIFFDGQNFGALEVASFFGSAVHNPKWFALGASGGANNQAPTAHIQASTTSGTRPLTVTLDASGSSDPEGGELAYRWELGDGAVSGGRVITHTYNLAGTFTVRLTVTDAGGLSGTAEVRITVTAPGGVPVEASETLPAEVTLFPNYPNPFSRLTTLRIGLPAAGPTRLEVVDLLGRTVRMLVNTSLPAGMHTFTFEAEDLPPGLYLVRLTTGGVVRTHRMLHLR
ncbi:M4 family metallopeptidase [Rhodocaloribacter litoris]|uniref:M4 family metallopeptidase n=1 Tax=Rhodocaloribacter litoris TaxID=2558931 RepID=UPI0014238D60|nr:M4 family metallopeptidase [Rhodocaloribacter litoris]QXD14199.1 M4 family metallopeptidase [Rhodocaloribacter litoris]